MSAMAIIIGTLNNLLSPLEPLFKFLRKITRQEDHQREDIIRTDGDTTDDDCENYYPNTGYE